jgi:hypothetical protein
VIADVLGFTLPIINILLRIVLSRLRRWHEKEENRNKATLPRDV